ncbi:MAG: RNA polymerase sigma factor [Phycisphaerales bacterium]
MSTDESLLRAFVAGEDEAIRALALRHERMLVGVARGLLGGDDEQARDVVQEAWVRVVRSAAGFRGDCSVKSWLVRIVMNGARDAARRRRSRERTMAAVRRRAMDGAGAGGGVSVVDEAEDRAIVGRAMLRLPEEQRECLVLCIGRGMSHAEAAATLGWPIGTVKTRVSRALRALRASVKELNGES